METKTASQVLEEQSNEWKQRAFGGDEPFTDGVTPEMVAARAQEVLEAKAKQDKLAAARQKREEFRGRTELVRIARKLRDVEFSGGLSEAEQTRTRQLLDPGARGKALRQGCNYVFFTHFRAQFYCGGGMNVLVMKHSRHASDVFRIADMARMLFWKYRKPGIVGVECTGEYLNYSIQRVDVDIDANPDIVALLNQYKDELLKTGVFSEGGEIVPSRRARIEKHYRNSTVIAKAKEVDEKVETALKAFVSANRRMDELTERMLTLDALRPTQENIALLSKRLTEVTGIALRMMARLEALEQRSLNVDAAQYVTVPAPLFDQPMVTCNQKEVVASLTGAVVS